MEDQKQITVTKFSLSGGMFPILSYREHLPGNDERTHGNVKCTSPAHADLIAAFKDFVLPLALISEEISNEQYIAALPNEYDATAPTEVEMGEIIPAIKASKAKKAGKQTSMLPEQEEAGKLIEKFDISTVEFKYINGIEGLVLSGEKRLSTHKWMGLGPTPLIKINDNDYKYTEDLFQAAELLKYEIGLYIIEHKYAPPVEPEFEFGDGPQTDIENQEY